MTAKPSRCVFWATVVAAMIGPAVAQTTDPKANEAAMDSLKTFEDLAPRLGWSGPGGAVSDLGDSKKGSKIGTPIPDYSIDLDALKKWRGGPMAPLMRPTGWLIYPIEGEDGTQSLVTVGKIKGEWKALTFGTPEEAEALKEAEMRSVESVRAWDGHTRQVRVPDLNVVFIGQQQADGQFQFTPIDSIPDLHLQAGKTESAQKVLFQKIQPAARRLNSINNNNKENNKANNRGPG